MKILLLWLMLALAGPGGADVIGTAHAVEPAERLADPALEARARAISAQLRCLVCQNESIDDSGAGLAHDIRMLVRERLAGGDTDAQVVQSVVNRYGQFVLLKPPVEPATYVLWFAPPIVLVLGLAGSVCWIVQRRRQAGTVPALSADERERLDALLRESSG
jgi:cytochrome c-type biogenesis protein CcmH